MKLSYGPETPYLKYHPKKMKALPQKDTCTIMFIAELQQARYRNDMCSLMYERIKKIHRYTHWNIHTHTHWITIQSQRIMRSACLRYHAYILRALC